MPEIKYSDNPNEETAFVETDDGQRNRAVLTVAVDGEIEFPANPNSTKVSVTVDGVKRKAIAVATIAGGGDQHNLGYYATQTALEEAYPTAEAGDWAIVGATDTVWIWDTDNSEWVDSDQKGQVTSVNGQTGAVSLTIPDAVQYSTMPTAGADNLGKIVQFTGTTDANYTNGYFYKCVSDGQDPATYSWSQVSVQPAPSGLPDQTGQSGKFLTTDGTDASWSDKPLVNTATGSNSITVLGTPATGSDSIVIGRSSNAGTGSDNVCIGHDAYALSGTGKNVCIGNETGTNTSGTSRSVMIGYMAKAYGGMDNIAIGTNVYSSNGSIQLGCGTGNVASNNDANTFKVRNSNGNFEIMSADGTIPEARLADTTNAAQGQVLTLDSNLNAVWQAGGGGSSYTAGTGIDITNDVISVTAPTLTNKATQSGSLVVGDSAQSLVMNSTAYGANSIGWGLYGSAFGKSAVAKYKATALGANTTANEYTIQLGQGGTNSDAGTMKVALTTSSDVTTNYELMSADGTIPAARHASLPATDGTYVLKLVIASGVPTLSWVAE